MFDLDRFLERAAIMEFEGGMTRFAAETKAAEAQGVQRWKAMEAAKNADRMGNPQQGGNNGQAPARQCQDDMPRVQRHQEEQEGSVPVGHVQAGRDRVELLALRNGGGRIL